MPLHCADVERDVNERTKLFVSPSSGSSYTATLPGNTQHESQPQSEYVKTWDLFKILIVALAIFSSTCAVIYKNRLDGALLPELVRMRREMFIREEQKNEVIRSHWINEVERLKSHWTEEGKRLTSYWTDKETKLKTHWTNAHSQYLQDVQKWDLERQQWDLERQQWSEERKREEKKQEEERRKKEEVKKEEERRRMGVSWDGPYGQECSAYGTRPYNAKVVNVPWWMDPVRVCADMPIEFHGRTVENPRWCERLGVG